MTKHTWWVLPLGVAACVACGGEATNDSRSSEAASTEQELSCVDRHPVTTESDLTGDIEVAACESLAPEPGEMAPPETPCQPSNVESAERGCELSGTPCEGAIVVSKAAALCVAEENGDLTTLQGPYADLTYHSGFQVPVWNVRTVTKTGREGRGGRTFTVDATTGEFLQATFFEETP